MHTIYLVVGGIAVAINAAIAGADWFRVRFVLANSAEVNVPIRWLPWLAACKAAGALGVLLGLIVDVPALVVTASAGLVLFFVGAMVFHVRARVFHNIAFPGFYLLIAIAILCLAVTEIS
jgi:DoxX-like family